MIVTVSFFMLVSRSMMLVEPDTLDVVPRGTLMAEEALIHFRLLDARGHHRNRLEVHHVVAWWSLMALSA